MMLSKDIRDLLLEENAKIKIDEDILYYGEQKERDKYNEQNSEIIELMFSTENKFEVTNNEVTQNHLNKLGLISYNVIFSDSGRFSILTKDMENILSTQV